MCCLSLLIQVTFFVHLIHLLIRANHLICNLGNMYDAFSVPVLYHYIAIRYSLFAIHVSCQTLFSSEVVVYLYFLGNFGIYYIVSNRHFFPSKIICYDCHLKRIFISLKSLRLSIIANYHIATFHYFLYFICLPFI